MQYERSLQRRLAWVFVRFPIVFFLFQNCIAHNNAIHTATTPLYYRTLIRMVEMDVRAIPWLYHSLSLMMRSTRTFKCHITPELTTSFTLLYRILIQQWKWTREKSSSFMSLWTNCAKRFGRNNSIAIYHLERHRWRCIFVSGECRQMNGTMLNTWSLSYYLPWFYIEWMILSECFFMRSPTRTKLLINHCEFICAIHQRQMRMRISNSNKNRS